jgi:hypothetical protein
MAANRVTRRRRIVFVRTRNGLSEADRFMVELLIPQSTPPGTDRVCRTIEVQVENDNRFDRVSRDGRSGRAPRTARVRARGPGPSPRRGRSRCSRRMVRCSGMRPRPWFRNPLVAPALITLARRPVCGAPSCTDEILPRPDRRCRKVESEECLASTSRDKRWRTERDAKA